MEAPLVWWGVAQWQSGRLLTGRLEVRVLPPQYSSCFFPLMALSRDLLFPLLLLRDLNGLENPLFSLRRRLRMWLFSFLSGPRLADADAELRAEFQEFSYDGLVQLGIDIENGAVKRGTW